MAFGIPTETFHVLVGAGIALVSSAFLNWNQRRVERDRVRRSLVFEASYISRTLEEFLDDVGEGSRIDDVEEALVSLSPDLLASDPARMNMLTTNEIVTVYEFYEAARLVELALKRQRDEEDYERARLDRQARRTIQLSAEVLDTVKRSRLSRFTEWYKDVDRRRGRGRR